jgi:hypothetical protein
MKKIYLISISLLFLSGCAMKTKILDTPAISMTHANLKPGEKLQETGPVSGKFCSDMWKDKGSFGLIDAAVTAAQDEHKIDFITNASFWNDSGCITVEGTGARIVTASAAPSVPAVPADTSHKAKKH